MLKGRVSLFVTPPPSAVSLNYAVLLAASQGARIYFIGDSLSLFTRLPLIHVNDARLKQPADMKRFYKLGQNSPR